MLKKCARLEHISLKHCCNITDSTLVAMGNATQRLRSVELSHNFDVTDAGLRALSVRARPPRPLAKRNGGVLAGCGRLGTTTALLWRPSVAVVRLTTSKEQGQAKRRHRCWVSLGVVPNRRGVLGWRSWWWPTTSTSPAMGSPVSEACGTWK